MLLGALACVFSEPWKDIDLAEKKKKGKTKTQLFFLLFSFFGRAGAVLLCELPRYLTVQVTVTAQKKGCQEG